MVVCVFLESFSLVLQYITALLIHRVECKQLAIHGFGGWSVGLEAALTSYRYEAAGKEIKVQRTAKRYDDDGDGKAVGLRLLLLAAVTLAARALPP